MKAEEIKLLKKEEIIALLKENTKELKYNPDAIAQGYAAVFSEYVISGNYILEEADLWNMILVAFYNFDPDIVEAIKDSLGWYNLMAWCFTNLKSNPQIEYYFNRYYDYHKEKVSTAEVLSTFITNFVEDFSEVNPDNVSGLISELGNKLKELPDIIKNN